MSIAALRNGQLAFGNRGVIHPDLYRWLMALKRAADLPWNEGDAALLEDVSLTAGRENLVEHGLGRAYKSWIVAKPQSPALVYAYTATTAAAATYFAVVPTADCVVDFVVF